MTDANEGKAANGIARVVVTGGTGFIGSVIVKRLSDAGAAVVVPTRKAARASHLAPLRGVEIVEADVHAPGTLERLVTDAQAAVNLVGILHSRSGTPYGPDFARAHVELPEKLVAACRNAGVSRLVHVSALGADTNGPSEYQRSKAAGETAIRAGGGTPAWTILRPSVVFGRGDSFLNLFAGLARLFPVLPLAGAHARFQPVHVEDVAEVVIRSLHDDSAIGQAFELAGPRTYSLRELVEYVCTLVDRRRLIIPLPEPLAMIQAAVMELAPHPLMSRDNVRSMRRDNVARGTPLPFGLVPAALEDVAPTYIVNARSRALRGEKH